ncbi:MAG: cation transporter [Acidimicrobiia bacterium]
MSQVTSARLRRRGLRLEYLTIAWNVTEAIVAVAAGVAAGSIALVGFGFDSSIEVFAATVVVWQFHSDEQGGVDEQRERRALRLIAITFFVLAAYVTVEAVRDLIADAEPDTSVTGIVLACLSLVVMPTLALAKRRTGRELGSTTLVADSAETFLCS